jgi:hypothetical protein
MAIDSVTVGRARCEAIALFSSNLRFRAEPTLGPRTAARRLFCAGLRKTRVIKKLAPPYTKSGAWFLATRGGFYDKIQYWRRSFSSFELGWMAAAAIVIVIVGYLVMGGPAGPLSG